MQKSEKYFTDAIPSLRLRLAAFRGCTDQMGFHARELLRVACALGGFALRLFLLAINPVCPCSEPS
jgi:hypothetical protein